MVCERCDDDRMEELSFPGATFLAGFHQDMDIHHRGSVRSFP